MDDIKLMESCMAKLTRKQISGLTDAELNRAMIWCYPDSRNYDGYYDEYMGYDYLSEYSLTMPLAVENAFSLSIYPSCARTAIVSAGDFMAHDENPLRAICEVLLMIAMEREA